MLLPNPRVYFDVAVGGKKAGRLVFQLFEDVLPITTENFRALCTGETGLGYWLRPRWFKDTHLHRIVKGLGCQGGDFNFDNGRMGESIYGQFFRDEKFAYAHSKRGVLSMAHSKKENTNSSNFFVTFNQAKWLDGKHVVFGQVESGWEALDMIEDAATVGGKPKQPVLIYQCGEMTHSEVCQHLEAIGSEPPRPTQLPMVDVHDPVPDEVYKRARPYWDNTL